MPGFEKIGITKLQVGQIGLVNFQYGQVGLTVDADNLGIDFFAGGLQDRAGFQMLLNFLGEQHLHLIRILHHVVVGNDVAVGIHNHPGTAAALQGDDAGSGLAVAKTVPLGKDLHRRRGDILR